MRARISAQGRTRDYRRARGRRYEATHRASGALVAVKVVEKKRLDKSEAVSFRREVRMHRRLHHRNIVGMHAFYNEGERYCIVMDLMAGGELFDKIVNRSHYSEREARDVVKVLAKALAYCHKKGIAHRCVGALSAWGGGGGDCEPRVWSCVRWGWLTLPARAAT